MDTTPKSETATEDSESSVETTEVNNPTADLIKVILNSRKVEFPESPAEFTADDLHLIFYPNPRLKQKSTYIPTDSEQLSKIVDRMMEIMAQYDGAGLAAPQTGWQARLIVANLSGQNRVMIDPVIVDQEGWETDQEGCLSFPFVFGQVKRHREIEVEYTTVNGDRQTEIFTHTDARIIQHECDHLNGKLFNLRLSSVDKFVNRRPIKDLETMHTMKIMTPDERREGEQPSE